MDGSRKRNDERYCNSSMAVGSDDLEWFPMNGALARFLALPLPDQAATLEALAAIISARVRLSLMSQADISRWLQPLLSGTDVETTANSQGSRGSIERIRGAVQRASRRVPGASCLVQAVAGSRMLAARGLGSRIRIGVEKIDKTFAAHAWLTVGDTIVLGGADASARFVEMRQSP